MSEEVFVGQGSGPVTAADVAAAVDQIAGGDPAATNAGAIRAHLGRGSPNTIQKHLNGLREAVRSAAHVVDVDDLPSMPLDEMQAVWRAAATAALKLTYARMAKLQQQRDDAHARLDLAESDLSAAQTEIDRLLESSRLAEDRATTVQAEAQRASADAAAALAEKEKLLVEKDERIKELERAQELDRIKSQAENSTLERIISQHAADLARLHESHKQAASDYAQQIAVLAAELAQLKSRA